MGSEELRKRVELLSNAQKSFYIFTKEIFSKSIINFVAGRYVFDACNYLAKYDRTMRIAARSHFKSVSFYAYCMFLIMFRGQNKDLDIRYFSYNESMAGEHIQKIKTAIRKNPYFDELIDLKSTAENVASYTWDRKHIINIRPHGIISFGRGLKADVILADDILSDPSNPLYPTVILKVNDLFRAVISECLNRGGEIHVIGCVNRNTRVLTNKGLEKIGDLYMPVKPNTYRKVMMSIYGIDGFHPTSHSYNKGLSKTKIITTKSGFELECSLEHPLMIMDKNGNRIWKKAEELRIGDWVAIQKNQQEFGFDKTLSKKEAYLMGLWIAEGSKDGINGSVQRLSICNSESEIKNFCKKMGWIVNSSRPDIYRKTSIKLIKRWERLGVKFVKSYDKTIPEIIFKSSKDIVIQFFRGLFDGDGSNTTRGVIFCSTSRQLIKEVQLLLLLFGVVGDIHQGKIKKGGIGHDGKQIIGKHIPYLLYIDGKDKEIFLEEIGFGLKRKQGLRKKRLNNGGHLIPYQGKFLKDILIKRGGKASDIINHRNIALSETLEELISDPYKIKFNESYCELKNNLKYFWNPVKNIQDGETEVIDFVIPNTHSFFSNGFISHNSPLSNVDFYYDEEIQKAFHTVFFPALVKDQDGNEIPQWPEFYTLEQIKSKLLIMGEKIFAAEMMLEPYYSADAYFNKEQLRKDIVNPQLRNLKLTENFFTTNLVVAGYDVGKEKHPAAFQVYEVKDGRAIMIHHKEFRKIPYYTGKPYDPLHPSQVEYIKESIKKFCIDKIYYDATRGELEGALESGYLTSHFVPIVFTYKMKSQLATDFGKAVLNKQVEIFDDEDILNSICSVTNDLISLETVMGHGDEFWTAAMALIGFNAFDASSKQNSQIGLGGKSIFEQKEIPKGF